MELVETPYIADKTSLSFTFKLFLGLARYIIRADYYLTLSEFGMCPKLSHRNESDSL